MKIYIKWGSVAIVIILIIGGLALFITKLFSSDNTVTENKPSPEQQAIIDTAYDTREVVKVDELNTNEKVYVMLHEMANTKIITEDGIIWGLKPITKDRVEAVQKAVKDLDIKDTEIDDMLNRWSKQDYSKSVTEHNYIWAHYLDGNIGKAKSLIK